MTRLHAGMNGREMHILHEQAPFHDRNSRSILPAITDSTDRYTRHDYNGDYDTERRYEVYGRNRPFLLGTGAHFAGDDRPR
jgi:hypothetical protein